MQLSGEKAAVVAAWPVHTEEMNVLCIFEMKTAREIYGAVKHGESCRTKTNKEIKDVLQREGNRGDTVKFIKTSPTRMVWSCWKNGKQRNAKTNCNNCNGRNKEQGRPRKR